MSCCGGCGGQDNEKPKSEEVKEGTKDQQTQAEK